MQICYSPKFLLGAELLPWFVLSVFLRMITYPMGFILLAAGAWRKYALITILFHGFHIAFVVALVPQLGLHGVAIINPAICFIYLFGFRDVCNG